jgi:hypothetical protein
MAKATSTGSRKSRLRLAAVLAAIAVGLVAAVAGGAFADNLPTPTLAVGSTTSPTINEGGSFSETLNYEVQKTGANNTNFPASVSFSLSGAPSWVQLNHTSLSFTGYSDVESLTVSGTAPAGASASSPYGFSIVPSTTATNLNVSPASVSMTVTVNAPVVTDSTAPTISFNPATSTWSTMAPATMTVTATDSDDGGVASLSCTLDGNPVTLTNTGSTATTRYGDISTSSEGDHAVACQAADSSNNSTSSDGPDLMLDSVAPSVSGAPTSDPNSNGWYNSNVTIQWTCNDATSGVVSCPSDSTISSEGTNETANSGLVYDNAGNSASANSSPAVNVDKTAPTIQRDSSSDSCTVPGNNGWCRGTQTAGFEATDTLSGFDSAGTLTDSFTESSSTEGSAVYISSGTVDDQAGNTGTAINAGPYKIDSTAPSVTCDIPAPTFLLNQSSADVTATVSDSLSQAASSSVSAAATTSSIGTHSVDVTGYDNAGNSTTVSCPYSVNYKFTGFLSPLNPDPAYVNMGNAGRTYPIKWQLTDGATPVSYITDAASATTVNIIKVACSNLGGDSTDSIDYSTTSTLPGIRYDSTANQYVYNWQTPSTKNSCYRMTITTPDGQPHVALFQMK